MAGTFVHAQSVRPSPFMGVEQQQCQAPFGPNPYCMSLYKTWDSMVQLVVWLGIKGHQSWYLEELFKCIMGGFIAYV